MTRHSRSDEDSAYFAQATLRDRVRALLTEQGMKQRDLADVLGLKQAAMSQRMTGHQWFSDSEIAATAAYLSTGVDELMKGSYHRHQAREARQARLARQTAEQAPERANTVRGLCCECGTMRAVKRVNPDRPRVYGETGDLTHGRDARRCLVEARCDVCQRTTTHAYLRADERAHVAEQIDRIEPSEDRAASDVDAYIEKLRTFNVQVYYAVWSRPEQNERFGYTPAIYMRFRKKRWHLTLNSQYPKAMQLATLKEAWRGISGDDPRWWDGCDPKKGVHMNANLASFPAAIEDLVAEIHQYAPAIRRGLAIDARDGMKQNDESESEGAER